MPAWDNLVTPQPWKGCFRKDIPVQIRAPALHAFSGFEHPVEAMLLLAPSATPAGNPGAGVHNFYKTSSEYSQHAKEV